MTLTIQLVDGDGKRPFKRIKKGTYRLGRDAECELQIDNSSVSRIHGLLCVAGALWYFKDLGSTNGSWINEKEVEVDQVYPVLSGDFLQVADVLFKLSYDGSSYEGKFIVAIFEGADLKGEYQLQRGEIQLVGGAEGLVVLPESAIDLQLLLGDTAISLENRSSAEILLNQQPCAGSSAISHGDVIELVEEGINLIIVDARQRGAHRAPHQPHRVDWQSHSRDLRPKESGAKLELFAPIRFSQATQPLTELDGNSERSFRPRRNTATFKRGEFFDFERMTDSEKQIVFLSLFFVGASALLFLVYYFLF